jgi:hypothetical protein
MSRGAQGAARAAARTHDNRTHGYLILGASFPTRLRAPLRPLARRPRTHRRPLRPSRSVIRLRLECRVGRGHGLGSGGIARPNQREGPVGENSQIGCVPFAAATSSRSTASPPRATIGDIMKNLWVPLLVLCAACSSTSSTTPGGEARPQGRADCTPGCCDDDPDCCAATSTVRAITLAAAAPTEPNPCCAPGGDCCATPTDRTR